MQKFIVMIAVLCSVVGYAQEPLSSAPPPPPKLDFPTYWSAIAYDIQNGAFGYGENSLKSGAEHKALAQCSQPTKRNNDKNCRIVIAGNHSCVALATGNKAEHYAAASVYRKDQAKAEQKALQQCREQWGACTLAISACGK